MSPIPAGPYLPTAGLVAQAWLAQRVPTFSAAMVASSLPRDVTTWADAGFVQVTIVPGAARVDSGEARGSLVQVDCWAVTVGADGSVAAKPPVAKATRLAELILRACDDDVQVFGRPVDMPANYLPARVLAVYPATDPSEIPGDPGGYARVTLDLRVDWARL
ncbi:tail terminator [Microbacterium phage OscarSo]|uniref:Tail terminator n=1 Tax=Microbacterium phage OscarSo TaxID=2985324 RepID=A0A9X9K3R3_9CAUD|nr:tail terminator [Microbacterium phage OscarSo]UYL87142.1 tail terminator [Microbacterium phage OscarSo]